MLARMYQSLEHSPEANSDQAWTAEQLPGRKPHAKGAVAAELVATGPTRERLGSALIRTRNRQFWDAKRA